MSVKLREKKLKNGNLSLYLDIYHKGSRNYEFLNLHLTKPAKTPLDRQHNKETKELANQIRAKKEIELQSVGHDHSPAFKRKASFIAFARKITQQKEESSRKAYNLVANKIESFAGSNDLRFDQINKQWCENFYAYLLDKVSINTAYDNFTKFSHFLNEAVRKEIISTNPAEKVDRKKRKDTHRAYLSFEEIQKLFDTPCNRPELKKAFLFACFTGLRWSDIKALTWGAIQHSEATGYYIDHRQIKTQSYETLPIPDQAMSLLGVSGPEDMGTANNPVFPGIYYSTVVMADLKLWAAKAGITKDITFHVARHTFATLQLTSGADIAIVSKLLGHKDIAVTQIYAKVIDRRKREAVNNLPKLKLKGDDKTI